MAAQDARHRGAWITGGGWLGLGVADPTVWTLAGVGDFSNDGKADVLWQHKTQGIVGAWITGSGWLGLGVADPTVWTLAGVGDFSNDGKADVLWQHKTQGIVVLGSPVAAGSASA